MDTREILLGAAEHIERYGWIQTVMVADCTDDKFKTCATCAVGAIKVVASDADRYLDICWWKADDVSGPAFRALLHVLAERYRHDPYGDVWKGSLAASTITDWNDDDHRTAEEVVAALRLAAASVTE